MGVWIRHEHHTLKTVPSFKKTAVVNMLEYVIPLITFRFAFLSPQAAQPLHNALAHTGTHTHHGLLSLYPEIGMHIVHSLSTERWKPRCCASGEGFRRLRCPCHHLPISTFSIWNNSLKVRPLTLLPVHLKQTRTFLFPFEM